MAVKHQSKLVYAINLVVMIVAVIAILGFLNWLSAKHYKRFNLANPTSEVLSDQTIQILKSLDQDVALTYFYTRQYGEQDEEMFQTYKNMLERYKSLSTRFNYELIDYAKNPMRVQNFMDETKDINIEEGASIIKSGDYVEKINDTSESALTQAIIKVTTGLERTVCFTEGHGEKDPDEADVGGYSSVKKFLKAENYAIRKFNVLRGGIPKECNVVVAPGPVVAFSEAEQSRLKKWIDAGGKALFLFEPTGPTGLESLLEEYGIIVKDNVLKTEDAAAIGVDPFEIFSENYDSFHPITEALSQTRFMMGDALRKIPMRMFEARALEVITEMPGDVDVTILISTFEIVREFPSTEAPTMRAMRRNRELDEDAPKGPMGDVSSFIVAAVAKKVIEKESSAATPEMNLEDEDEITARIVVYGDSDWAADGFIEGVPNADLFLNTIAWLAEEEQTIGIRPREKKFIPIQLSGSGNWMFLGGLLFLVPLVLVINAIFVWREKKRM